MTHQSVSGELAPRPSYTPAPRSTGRVSPVRRIMNLQSEALIDRAKITAEVSNVRHLAVERMNAAFDLAEHAAVRSAELTRKIAEMGNDPELHQLHSYIKGGVGAAVMDLMQGPGEET